MISIGGDFLEGRAIPLWILLLAVLAGLVFLALVSLILWHCGFFRRDRHHDQHQMHNGSVIHANEVYLHEAANVHEKEPLTASAAAASTTATITSNGFHHRQSRHSRHSLTYPHHMQPGDEVL